MGEDDIDIIENNSKKKEVQSHLIENPIENERASEEEVYNVLKAVAPGTNLRTAINSIMHAGRGALIVIDNGELSHIIDGGFRVYTKFTPQKLVELAKMDGGFILSKDLKKILFANTLMTPNSHILTKETGTRHKAAERTAKQAGTLVIAVSERRREITLYYKNFRYVLPDVQDLLRKANENIQMLEKQRELFDDSIQKLNLLELKSYVGLETATKAIQRGEMIKRIADDLAKSIVELGKEGDLIKVRLKEVTADVERETDLIIKDYTEIDLKRSKLILESIPFDQLLEQDNILRALDYNESMKTRKAHGWRILAKTSLHEQDIAAVIRGAGARGLAIDSSIEFHRSILGEEKAKIFEEELQNIKRDF